ncbi:MAG: hypothetical protein UT32_C0009G0058 [Parcubacteria group bacterium GW2011_GWC2_39_14]|nr:MAG: hypothetical protein UT32_C0009G0058 [Parcubacteria group bacterium GW2011_GWC2_39_14]KKR55396.1 MAG: hypothetical protein UT91_C0002G0057 [Parcubacteria group bacterium GW2011_GWA2_40_23]
MLIIEKSFSFQPFIDLQKPEININDIIQRIEEYIHEKTRKTIIDGQPVHVLNISGLADYHHNELANYLRSNRCDCNVESGEFGETPIKHCWIKINDLLIDLTIKQFENCPNCAPSYLRQFFDTHCYVSNNSESLIYKLYRKTDD